MGIRISKYESVTLDVGDAELTLKSEAIARLWIEKLQRQASPAGVCTCTRIAGVPRIGAQWEGQGGIYAGMVRGRDGAPDYALIVHGEAAENIAWQPAKDWAGGREADGHSDFSLPTRSEQAILFGNVPDLFKPEWYWSSEQPGSASGYAWSQDFRDGHQTYDATTYKLRARAVRRLPIE